MSTLQKLAEANDVLITETKNYKRVPPFYFDSLRQGLLYYFNTFRTKNASYDSYIKATSTENKRTLQIMERQFLDEENTVLSLVSLERFFELFIKGPLQKTHPHLGHSEDQKNRSRTVFQMIGKIQSRTFMPYTTDGKYHMIPFRETLKRFYALVSFAKDPAMKLHPLVKKFNKIFVEYSFLDNPDFKQTLQLLNWYRDRILHNGNKLPSLRFFDYLITQKVIPIIIEIKNVTATSYGHWWFFSKTITGINILEQLAGNKWDFKNRRSEKGVNEAIRDLLFIAHFKEIARANQNMNAFVRLNNATYEYNYKDPIGRGKRFAAIELKEHPEAKQIEDCVCCGNTSMVVYSIKVNDIFNKGAVPDIGWVKCYTCDYHIRFNIGEPSHLNLSSVKYFSE